MQDIRWKQRFENFKGAYKELEPLKSSTIEELSAIYRMAYTKAFEMSFELMWKTMKDYLKENKVSFRFTFPKFIIQEAAGFGMLEDMDVKGKLLIQMLDSRNKLVHTYDEEGMFEILDLIKNEYIEAFDKFKKWGDEN